MTDYARKWTLAELPVNELSNAPLVTSKKYPMHAVAGVDSTIAKEREARGADTFYYDYEQLEAGLDKVYGMADDLKELTETHTFSDGTTGREGALVMQVTRFDPETGIFTVLVEQP